MTLQKVEVHSKKVWEDFVQKYSPDAFFQSWLWGEVQLKTNHTVWRLGFVHADTLVGISQVVKITAKRGIFLHVRHGPIFRSHTVEHWSSWLQLLADLGREESAWFLRLSPKIDPSAENHELFRSLRFLPAPVHAQDAEICWVLDLGRPEDELLGGMRKSTRYDIRRGLKMDTIQIHKSLDSSLFPIFGKLYKETAIRQHFIPHVEVQEEVETFAKERRLLMLLGLLDGRPVAAAIIVFYGNQAIYRHGASVPSHAPVSTLLQWEAINEANKRSLSLYNFWGISPDDEINHPWKGLTEFKKGFGGRKIEYIHSADYPLSPKYTVTSLVESMRKMVKGYS